jgi:hypothetical protein
MKSRYVYVFLLVAGAVFLSACGSTTTTETPPPAPPPPRETPPPAEPSGPGQAALDALDAAIARAERERKQAEDFGASSYFPGDWESSEASYRSITADRSSPQGVAEAERLYNEAADRYNELFRRAVVLYAGDLEEELLKARSEALAAGAGELVPEYLATADQAAGAARDLFSAEDYYKAGETGREALDRYRALAAGAEAYKIREEITRLDFAGFDADNFNQGDQALSAAAAAYEEGSPADALSAAAESRLRYDTALKAGWAAYAAQLRILAQNERQNAINAKANVAVREDFTVIEAVFNEAESSYRSAAYESAVNSYVVSEAGFVALTEAAEAKRRFAQAAIDAAERKLEESENTALAAEGILEGDQE